MLSYADECSQELLARLKGEVSFIEHDRTKVNHTLPFPLRHSFYVDFTHDNQMAAVVSAMGLFKDESPPMASSLDPARQWVFSSIAPFGGRLVVERISCAGALFVRVLANDRVLKLVRVAHLTRMDTPVLSIPIDWEPAS